MTQYHYSSTAVATSLSGNVNSSQTTIAVASTTGLPVLFPYKLLISRGSASFEAVKVTAAAGTTLTVVRGIDGTSAQSHTSGDTVEHGVTGADFQDASDHAAATAGVHGLLGAVVGDTDAQTLSNKNIVDPTVVDGDFTTPTLHTPTIDDFSQAPHNHSSPLSGGSTLGTPAFPTTLVGGPHIDDLTNAQHDHSSPAEGGNTLNGPTLVVPHISDYTQAQHAHADAASGGVIGGAAQSNLAAETLTVTGATSNPSFTGGVTATGGYAQVLSQHLAWIDIEFAFGSCTSLGSGLWTFTFAVNPTSPPAGVDAVLHGTFVKGTGERYPVTAVVNAGAWSFTIYAPDRTTRVSDTWFAGLSSAAGATLRLAGSYRI